MLHVKVTFTCMPGPNVSQQNTTTYTVLPSSSLVQVSDTPSLSPPYIPPLDRCHYNEIINVTLFTFSVMADHNGSKKIKQTLLVLGLADPEVIGPSQN